LPVSFTTWLPAMMNKNKNNQQQARLHQKLFKKFHKNSPLSGIHPLLEEDGLDPNLQDKQGRTMASHICSRTERSSVDLLKKLGTMGASMAIADRDGLTPLHFAAAAKNPDHIDVCLRLGADPTATNTKGRTALHVACRSHLVDAKKKRKQNKSTSISMVAQKECMDLIVNACPQLINQRDHQGRTPLFDCLEGVFAGASWGLMIHMMELGADLTIVDYHNHNLAHHILLELEVGGMQPRAIFETQCIFRMLVNNQPRLLSERDSDGLTPFMMVCLLGDMDLIYFFLKEHCAINELL